MKNKRLLAFITACIAVFPILSACGGDSQQTNAPASQAVAEQTQDDKNYTIELPEESYENRDFVILCEGGAGSLWANNEDFFLEEDSDDGVKSAIYQRVQIMKEEYGINIIPHLSTSTTEALHTSIQSGDNAYNAIFAMQSKITTSAANGDLMDLFEAENLDLSKHYWDQNVPELLSISNQLFFTTGDILTMEELASWVLTFNKKMAKMNDLPDLYQLVRDNEWTIDKFNELLAGISVDNGDGIWDHTDTYALATHNDNAYGLFYSCGLRFVTKDKDDIPIMNIDEMSKIVKVAEMTVEMQERENKTINAHDWINVNPLAHEITIEAFQEDRALFFAETLDAVIKLRDMETDFGIIPLPKYDKQQENYITFVNPAGSFVGIPKSEQTRDGGYFASYALEAMAYLGYKHITPQFIEKAVMGKSTRDDESVDMLRIIFANRTYDLGIICGFGDIATDYSELVNSGKSAVTSAFARKQKRAAQEIKDFVSKITE